MGDTKALWKLLLQFLGLLVLSWAAARMLLVSSVLSGVLMWGVLPPLGALSAYLVTRKGVNNYLGWMPPPLAMVSGHYLAFFFLPSSAGPVFLCAFCAVVGAAVGDTRNRFERRNGGKRK